MARSYKDASFMVRSRWTGNVINLRYISQPNAVTPAKAGVQHR